MEPDASKGFFPLPSQLGLVFLKDRIYHPPVKPRRTQDLIPITSCAQFWIHSFGVTGLIGEWRFETGNRFFRHSGKARGKALARLQGVIFFSSCRRASRGPFSDTIHDRHEKTNPTLCSNHTDLFYGTAIHRGGKDCRWSFCGGRDWQDRQGGMDR